MPREIDMDGDVLSREDISKCLNDPELFRLLDERGAIGILRYIQSINTWING